MAKLTLENLDKRITALEQKSGVVSYNPDQPFPNHATSSTNKRIPIVNSRTLKHKG